MKALIDTCVIVDVLQSREPFCKAANHLFIFAIAITGWRIISDTDEPVYYDYPGITKREADQ